MESIADEVMLAQEQGVIMRVSGERKELEGALGDELEGTIVLTNRRLIFVCTNEREDDLTTSRTSVTPMRLVYSDVEDLASIPNEGGNVFIPLSSITSVKGHTGHVERPSLEAEWEVGEEEKGRVFIERLSGRSRQRNLNDWAPVIERLKVGDQKLVKLPKAPGAETLEGKIMVVLADMQKKGAFEIEEEVEDQFKIKLDPDKVQAACENLARTALLDKLPDPSGDTYYQKRSPLGDDRL
jgi:hypothetical protein